MFLDQPLIVSYHPLNDFVMDFTDGSFLSWILRWLGLPRWSALVGGFSLSDAKEAPKFVNRMLLLGRMIEYAR